jgi:hypothetical protein
VASDTLADLTPKQVGCRRLSAAGATGEHDTAAIRAFS